MTSKHRTTQLSCATLLSAEQIIKSKTHVVKYPVVTNYTRNKTATLNKAFEWYEIQLQMCLDYVYLPAIMRSVAPSRVKILSTGLSRHVSAGT